jgi:hypothetical protein
MVQELTKEKKNKCKRIKDPWTRAFFFLIMQAKISFYCIFKE